MASEQENIELRHRWPQTYYALPQGNQYPPEAFQTSSDTHQVTPTSYLSTSRTNYEGENLPDRPLLSHQTGSSWDYSQHTAARSTAYSDYTSRTASDTLLNNEAYDLRYHENEQSIKPNTRPARTPKYVTRANWTRHFHGWLIHVPAVLMTTAVVVLGTLPIYWHPEEGALVGGQLVRADIVANVLQLAAKIHEILIIMSLSAVALSMFRRRLIANGVRLGFLTGGYRVGDVAYLATAAFWRQGLDTSRPWEMLLSGYLVFATIMSTIVGPASAVLLVPTLGWYGFKPGSAFQNITLPLIYLNRTHEVWSTHFQTGYDPCGDVEGTLLYQSFCPGAGFPEILNWADGFGATDLSNNLTLQSTSSEIRRYLNFTQADNNVTLCSTLPHFLMNSVGLFQKFIDNTDVGAVSKEPRYRLNSKDHRYYQPFVQSKCDIHTNDSLMKSAAPVIYPVADFNCFDDTDCQQLQQTPRQFQGDRLNGSNYYDTKYIIEYSPTLDNSSVIFASGFVPYSPDEEVYLCTLFASWVPTTFSYDPKVSDIIQSQFKPDQSMQELARSQSTQHVRPIKFDQEWVRSSNPKWNSSATTSNTTLGDIIDKLLENQPLDENAPSYMASISSKETPTQVSLAKIFGAYLTESIARNSYGSGTYVKLQENDTDLMIFDLTQQHGYYAGIYTFTANGSNSTALDFQNETYHENGNFTEFRKTFQKALQINIEAERYGYGSGQHRRTLYFALAMMYIYLGTVFTYAIVVSVGYVLEFVNTEFRGQRIRILSVLPWSDLQDLILLALRTPPPRDEDLADAGAGVTNSKVWEKVVRARADEDDNVQLVLGDTAGTNELDMSGRKLYF